MSSKIKVFLFLILALYFIEIILVYNTDFTYTTLYVSISTYGSLSC